MLGEASEAHGCIKEGYAFLEARHFLREAERRAFGEGHAGHRGGHRPRLKEGGTHRKVSGAHAPEHPGRRSDVGQGHG